MSWAMLPGGGIRILTAAVTGGLVAIFVLSASAPAFAVPAPPDDPVDCAIDPTKLSCQTNESNIPTSPDDPRCVQMPLSAGCEGGPWDDDDF
jgi:hypothetical protein